MRSNGKQRQVQQEWSREWLHSAEGLSGPAVAIDDVARRAPASDNHAVDAQQHNGSHDSESKAADAPIVNTGAAPQRAADPSAEYGAGNAQKHGDDPSARVFPRHQEFGNRSGDQTEDDPANYGSHSSSQRNAVWLLERADSRAGWLKSRVRQLLQAAEQQPRKFRGNCRRPPGWFAR